jgi:hypothetical protein
MKSKAPQLHLEYRFYKLLGSHGKKICIIFIAFPIIFLNLKLIEKNNPLIKSKII